MVSYTSLFIALRLLSLTSASPVANHQAQDLSTGSILVKKDTEAVEATAAFKCQVQTGTNVFRPHLAGWYPTKQEVEMAVAAWLNEVCTVNDFLNSKGTSLAVATAWATDEPNELAILSAVKGLSKEGQNAAAVLRANFPSVLANLDNIKTGSAPTKDASVAINFDRCCQVVPSVAILVDAAVRATGAFGGVAPKPEYPNVCSRFQCSVASI